MKGLALNQETVKTGRIGVITGSTGFVGFHLAQHLLQNGWVLHLIVREASKIEKLRHLAPQANVHIHKHDGAVESLISLFQKVRPQIVFHLAAETVVEHRPAQIKSLLDSNILLGTQVLEAMIYSGCQNLINTGSYWQHFQSQDYNPVNLYAATKEAFECILRYYTECGSIRAVTLKLFDVYGPQDERHKLFSQLEQAFLSHETLAISPGDQKLDFVYIDDVIRAYLHAADLMAKLGLKSGPDYAVSSGKHITLRKAVEVYQRATGRKIKVQFGGRPYRKREVMVPWKGKTLPGWRAKIDLETGIRLMNGPVSTRLNDQKRVHHVAV